MSSVFSIAQKEFLLLRQKAGSWDWGGDYRHLKYMGKKAKYEGKNVLAETSRRMFRTKRSRYTVLSAHPLLITTEAHFPTDLA